MEQTLLNIGFGSSVVAGRVVAIVSPKSAPKKRHSVPMKRLKDDAKEENRLVDATHGRETRVIIIMDSNHVVLSAIQSEKITGGGEMEQTLLNIGFGSSVVAERVVAIVSPNSSPMKRLKDDAKEEKRLVNVTHGHKVRVIIVMDSNHVVLSAVRSETISKRYASLKESK